MKVISKKVPIRVAMPSKKKRSSKIYLFRNCYNNLTNHGESCSGEGIIYDKDYVHRNVLYVFKYVNLI